MESLDLGEDNRSVNGGPRIPELAGISIIQEQPARTSPGTITPLNTVAATLNDVSRGHVTPHDNQAAAGAVSPAPDANTAITNLYLTFNTVLPAPNTSNENLPPRPDLSAYTDPQKWPSSRKNVMLFFACLATLATAYTAGAYSPPIALIATEFGVSRTAAATGITAFTVGFGLAPMILAPFSEINGRYPVFVVSGIVWVIFQATCGVVNNLAGMVAARFLCGAGGSVFSTMVGGVIADLWEKDQRNTPMALFSGSVLVGTGLSPLVASVMVQQWSGEGYNTNGPAALWRWVFWHQVIFGAVLMAAIIMFFGETRGAVLLSRKAGKLNKWYEAMEAKGAVGVWVPEDDSQVTLGSSSLERLSVLDEEKAATAPLPLSADEMAARGLRLRRVRWLVKEDEQRTSIAKMVSISVIRPFHLLFTEPVVFFFSLWVSFAWAILYLTFGSVPLVMARQYNFNTQQSGYVFTAMIVGSILATIVGIWQEKFLKHPSWQRKAATADDQSGRIWSFMRRKFPVETPEARVYFACITSILLPIGLYLFGFAAEPSIHWIVPALAIMFATIGIYYIYLATFNYLADSYQEYASSALAAQSFCRNMLAGAFPLLVTPLFVNLGEDAAGGLLGAIATALTIVPWVLAFFGEKIRRRSRFAVALQEE